MKRKSGNFVYCDNFTTPEYYLGERPEYEVHHLGKSLIELDSKRYTWSEKITLPSGKTWNRDAEHFKDSEYVFSKISLFDNDPDLYIKFTPSQGRNGFIEVAPPELEKIMRPPKFSSSEHLVWFTFKQCALYLTVKNYAELAAFTLINEFRNPKGGESLGRHFENAILTFWNERGLELY